MGDDLQINRAIRLGTTGRNSRGPGLLGRRRDNSMSRCVVVRVLASKTVVMILAAFSNRRRSRYSSGDAERCRARGPTFATRRGRHPPTCGPTRGRHHRLHLSGKSSRNAAADRISSPVSELTIDRIDDVSGELAFATGRTKLPSTINPAKKIPFTMIELSIPLSVLGWNPEEFQTPAPTSVYSSTGTDARWQKLLAQQSAQESCPTCPAKLASMWDNGDHYIYRKIKMKSDKLFRKVYLVFQLSVQFTLGSQEAQRFGFKPTLLTSLKSILIALFSRHPDTSITERRKRRTKYRENLYRSWCTSARYAYTHLGKGAPGTPVKVRFANQTKTTKSDQQGKWQVQLDPLPANSSPAELTVISGENHHPHRHPGRRSLAVLRSVQHGPRPFQGNRWRGSHCCRESSETSSLQSKAESRLLAGGRR